MPEFKSPRINTPQCSPFAPNQKEWYKHEHAHPVRINPLKSDTSASFDDDEDQFFKKLKLRNDTPTSFFGIPALAAPSNITLSENSLAIVPKTLGNDPSKPRNLEHQTEGTYNFVDSDVEKEIYGVMGAHRIVLNEGANYNFMEIRHKQHHQKLLHQERDKLLKDIEERATTSKALSWVQIASTVALFGVALVAAAFAIVTGNVPGVIGIAGATAGAAQGIAGGTNGFYSMRTKEAEGIVKENKLQSELEHNKVTALLTNNQTTLAKIHDHDRNESTILRNRSQIRMF